jgi:choline dehydrogenase
MQGGLNEIGIPTITDFNSGSLLGTQYCSTTIQPSDESRDSSQTSFLNQAAEERLTNLKVFSLTMAKKINFDANKKATGVIVESNLLSYTLGVNKEVIVSAGAFQSPQLLMVSGIGPASQLVEYDIPVIVDAPGVGQNLQDHIFFGPAYRVDLTTFTRLANDPAYLASELVVYETSQMGPLTNQVADFLGWEKIPQALRPTLGSQALSDLAKYPSDWPEVEYLSGAGYVGDWSSLLFAQPKDGYQYATILAALVAPQSRGNVTLNSADTNDLPTISTAYLQSTTDQEVAIAAYKRVRQAFASQYMQQTVIGAEYYPGEAVQTDDEILSVNTAFAVREILLMAFRRSRAHSKLFGMQAVPARWECQATQWLSLTLTLGYMVSKVSESWMQALFPFCLQDTRRARSVSFSFPLFCDHMLTCLDALAEKIADDIKNGE